MAIQFLLVSAKIEYLLYAYLVVMQIDRRKNDILASNIYEWKWIDVQKNDLW